MKPLNKMTKKELLKELDRLHKKNIELRKLQVDLLMSAYKDTIALNESRMENIERLLKDLEKDS